MTSFLRCPLNINPLIFIVMITAFTFFLSCDDSPVSTHEGAGDPSPQGGLWSGGMITNDAGETSLGGDLLSAGEPQSGEVEDAGESITGGIFNMAGDDSVAGEVINEGGTMGEMNPIGLYCEEERPKSSRLVALSFPHSETVGEQGRSIQVFELSSEGTLTPWGDRLELARRNSAMSFTRDGLWLIASDDRGQLTAIDLRGELPQIGQSLTLPVGAYRAIQYSPERRRFDIINSNSDELAGIYSVSLSCEGQLDVEINHHALRLIQGFERITHTEQSNEPESIIFGGQAMFEPFDHIDLRWLSWFEGEWRQIAELDLYEDFIDAINVGIDSSGTWITAVNGSPFSEEGGQIRFVKSDRSTLSLEETQRFEGFEDVRGAWFLPNDTSMFVTQFEPNAVQFFNRRGEEWGEGQRITGLGLVEQAVMMNAPGTLDTDSLWILLPSTIPSGESGLMILNVLEGSSVMTLPMAILGNGYANIPQKIAIWPPLDH